MPVEIRAHKTGLHEVRHHGPVSLASFLGSRWGNIAATRRAGAIVGRLDTGVVLITQPPPSMARLAIEVPPAALVVPDAQLDMWRAYCLGMSRAGIMRVAFSASQWEQAYRWAEVLAGLAR